MLENPFLHSTIFKILFDDLSIFIGIYEAVIPKPLVINSKGLEIFKVKTIEEFKEKYPVDVRKDALLPEVKAKLHENFLKQGLWSEKMVCLRHDGSTFTAIMKVNLFTFEEKKYLLVRLADTNELFHQLSDLNDLSTENETYTIELETIVSNRTAALINTLQELEKSKQELSLAYQREHHLNTIKSQFVTAASHELRTPLSVLSSSLTLFKKYTAKGNQEKQAEHLEIIEANIKYFNSLIDKILAFDIENQENTEKLENLDLHEIAKEAKNEKNSAY